MDYDRSGIEVDVPDKNLSAVLTMNTIRALENPTLSVKDALSRPIAGPSFDRIAKGRRNACVVVSDITRPVPHNIILPPLLDSLEENGLLPELSLLHISEPTRRSPSSYAVFCWR